MRESLKNKIEIMFNNYLILEKEFPWEQSLTRHFIALINAVEVENEMDIEGIKTMAKAIKEDTGWLSTYRGTFKLMLAALLVRQYDHPREQFKQMLINEEELRDVGFKNNMFLPIANYALLITSDEVESQMEIKERAKEAFAIYLKMKENHPWLTGGDDYPLAVLLAEFDNPIEKVEAYYKMLNENGFYKGGSLQLLSHILSFSDEPIDVVVERCLHLQTVLKENKLNLAQSYYSALGMISIIKDETGELMKDLVEVSKELIQLKKFKWLGKGMNVLLASALVSGEWMEDAKLKQSQNQLMHTAMSISIETLIAAQTAATVAAITASTTAAAAAASN